MPQNINIPEVPQNIISEGEAGAVFWRPQEDITIYELAMALGILLPAASGSIRDLRAEVDGLPENVRRHFR